MGTFVIVHPISTDKNINYKGKTISIAIDIMIGGEDLGANLQEVAENAKKNLEAGLDNLNVDQLAGQLNDLGEEAVNKLNEKLNSGIVPQGNMMSMMIMILMIIFLTKVFFGRSIN